MKTNWRMRRRGGLLNFAAITLLLAACGQPVAEEKKESEQQPIKVGVILPLTGRLATMGEVERNAMLLAAKDVNAEGNRIILQFEDGMGTAKDAVAAANKLLDIEHVDAVVTSTTGASLAVQPIATTKKRNQIAFCMDPDIAMGSDYTTRLYTGIDDEARAIIKYFNGLGSKARIAVLHARVPAFDKVINDTYVPAFKAAGHEVVYLESYEVTQTDFRNPILKLGQASPEHLLLLGYGFEYPAIYKELQDRSLIGRFTVLGGWGFLYTDVDKSLLEGTLVSGPEYVFQRQEDAGRFFERYRTMYGAAPNFDAAFAYGMIHILANNLDSAHIAEPLKHRLHDKGALKGVAGTFYVDESGNMLVSTALGIYKNGILELYQAK